MILNENGNDDICPPWINISTNGNVTVIDGKYVIFYFVQSSQSNSKVGARCNRFWSLNQIDCNSNDNTKNDNCNSNKNSNSNSCNSNCNSSNDNEIKVKPISKSKSMKSGKSKNRARHLFSDSDESNDSDCSNQRDESDESHESDESDGSNSDSNDDNTNDDAIETDSIFEIFSNEIKKKQQKSDCKVTIVKDVEKKAENENSNKSKYNNECNNNSNNDNNDDECPHVIDLNCDDKINVSWNGGTQKGRRFKIDLKQLKGIVDTAETVVSWTTTELTSTKHVL